jgi:hypothetical protein
MPKRFFSQKELDEMDFPENAVEKHIIDHRRWHVTYEVVIPFEGKFYRGFYIMPATEMQSPTFDTTSGDFEEVTQVEQVVKVWVATEEGK